jgi:hypothetical protein
MASKAHRIAAQATNLAARDQEPPRTELEADAQALRARTELEAANEPVLTPEAEANGDYVRDGNKGYRNRRSTPIARWKAENLLSETQSLAIDYCVRLWERAGRFSGLTMDLMKITGLPPSSGWSQQEALDELKHFKERIPFTYWNVFENVCRFDMPAGVAGSHLQGDRNKVNVQAWTIVCFVADLIATWKRL